MSHSIHNRLSCNLPHSLQELVRYGNEVPLDSEAKKIETSIAVAQKNREDLAIQITEAQLKLFQLEREDKLGARHIVRSTAALGAPRRLPAEVLSRIFSFYQQFCFDHPKQHILDSDRNDEETGAVSAVFLSPLAVYRISEVCTYRRNVAFSTQAVWPTVRYDCTPQKMGMTATIGTWLERGGNLPLSFSFTCRGQHNGRIKDNPLASPPIGYPCHDIFQLLLSLSRRWKDVQLTAPETLIPQLWLIR
ncbi:hypothetical protein B0H11DRAFT_2429686 [Mycena galericulata]|nr:hypothetical protein B0H11DRAFT_2429686 [Mycena galericulata]